MLMPYNPASMVAYAVNRAVNSVKNDTEECIERCGQAQLANMAPSIIGPLARS